jgi:nucleoside-diphosphate-sugar epimerase
MNVLITGGAGFLGARVIAELRAHGHAVTGTSRSGRRDLVTMDLGDPHRVSQVLAEHRPDAVVHLGWHAVHPTYPTAPENTACLAEGMQLVELAADHGCRRFVGAGSCMEYYWSHARLDEHATPCRPSTLYGECKLALGVDGERLARSRRMSFAWLRYGFVFGEGEAPTRLMASAIEAFAAGRDVSCSTGTAVRDFLHVGEAASATRAIVESQIDGAINVGSGELMSVRAMVEAAAAACGGRGQPRFGELPDRAGEPPVLELALDRLHREVGWRPGGSVRDGIARMVAAAGPR